jgi:hypothetical protein
MAQLHFILRGIYQIIILFLVFLLLRMGIQPTKIANLMLFGVKGSNLLCNRRHLELMQTILAKKLIRCHGCETYLAQILQVEVRVVDEGIFNLRFLRVDLSNRYCVQLVHKVILVV